MRILEVKEPKIRLKRFEIFQVTNLIKPKITLEKKSKKMHSFMSRDHSFVILRSDLL